MRRVLLTVLFALAMLPALAAERPEFLLRVERIDGFGREALLAAQSVAGPASCRATSMSSSPAAASKRAGV